MPVTQPSSTVTRPEKSPVEATSATSGPSLPEASSSGSGNISNATTATTQKASQPTSKQLDLNALRLRASLLVSDIGQWKKAGGKAAKRTVVAPDGRKVVYIAIALDGGDVEVVDTPDGWDLAVNSGTVGAE